LRAGAVTAGEPQATRSPLSHALWLRVVLVAATGMALATLAVRIAAGVEATR
jgi:hypothetical protein